MRQQLTLLLKDLLRLLQECSGTGDLGLPLLSGSIDGWTEQRHGADTKAVLRGRRHACRRQNRRRREGR